MIDTDREPMAELSMDRTKVRLDKPNNIEVI